MALEDRIRLPALNLIHRRQRLLNVLTEAVEAGNRLITVYAPGGYGKSILLADFAQTTDLPVCWCSLEPADRDPTAFLILLTYSITDRFHEIERSSLLDLVQQGDTQVSVRRIADRLADIGPHLIILDDYHKAISAGMTLALNRLLDQLPPDSTIIVAARGDMMLETSQVIDLLIDERATGLSEEELRFTPPELQRVMRKRFGRQIELARAGEIAQATDGNIAQILLTGHLMHANGMISRLEQRLGDDQEVIYGYLAEEVFDKQAPELQRFLLHTAVLPDMTPELCNELLEISNAQAHLEELVRKDLFVTQVGAGFRYHDLFTEFLQTRLAEDEAQRCQVSIRAGNLLAARGRFEEAVTLYLSVQAWDETVALLETQGRLFYDTGRALTLNHWLAEIPEPELARRPRLLLLQGQILNRDLDEPKLAMAFFERAEEQFRQQDDLIGVAEAQMGQSVSLRKMGHAQESLGLATKALNQLNRLKADDQVMALAIRSRGIAHWWTGNIAAALTDIRQALELFERLGDKYMVGICHHEIGINLERQGHISGAEHHYQQALRIWETSGNTNDLANTLNSLGVCFYLRGNYRQALEQFKESLEIALQIGAARRAAFAQAGIGDVYLARQEYEQGIEAYTRSTEFAQEASVRSLEIYNLVKLGECAYQQHDLAEALKLANQAREVAAETGLNFEKGLACALQAKIYVRRAEYGASFDLFAEALASFAENDVLELAKTRLWWGYSLLLDLRAAAALAQLQEAIRLILAMEELLPGLGPTVAETRPLLLHFRYRGDTPTGLRDSIRQLLKQDRQQIEVARPSLQIFAFGPASLVAGGEYKHFFSQRGKIHKMPEFLLYMILEGREQGRRWTEISAAIWPELDTERVSRNFHQTIKRLRDSIFGAPDYVIVQSGYYRINPAYLEWCDALAFDLLFERAATAGPADVLDLLMEMIALYQGQFLAGFELEEWGATCRSRYEARFLQAVRLASDQLLKEDQARQALNVLQQGLSQDYLREDLHRSAAQAYAHLGLAEDLAEHYQELRATFERELGLSPAPETQDLFEQLMGKK
jgi:ATP/maltotriose-dependent transcriptional regulator MalT/two-component SAPR family response regulator